MSDSDAKSISMGDLYTRGWRQGSLFYLPSAVCAWNKVAPPEVKDVTVPHHSRLRGGEMLVVVSQDCDIKFPKETEPHVEALVCTPCKDQRILDGADSNSIRFFLVYPDRRLVADTRLRVLVRKEALLEITPEPWPRDALKLRKFVVWLGRRYTRPAVPDEIESAFRRPVDCALRRLLEESPHLARAFSCAVEEVRWRLVQDEAPPFVIQLVLLFRSDALTSEEADAVDIAIETMQVGLDPQLARLNLPVRKATEEDMSVREFFDTAPLFLEYLTYRGDEVLGAEPPRPG